MASKEQVDQGLKTDVHLNPQSSQEDETKMRSESIAVESSVADEPPTKVPRLSSHDDVTQTTTSPQASPAVAQQATVSNSTTPQPRVESDLGLEVEFMANFEARYQRNNKRTGRKNLRCFPMCTADRHVLSGFCGRPVTCRISGVPEDPPKEEMERISEELVELDKKEREEKEAELRETTPEGQAASSSSLSATDGSEQNKALAQAAAKEFPKKLEKSTEPEKTSNLENPIAGGKVPLEPEGLVSTNQNFPINHAAGSSLYIGMDAPGNSNNSTLFARRLRAWAKFQPCEDKDDFEVGQYVNERELWEKARDRKSPKNPWMRGDIDDFKARERVDEEDVNDGDEGAEAATSKGQKQTIAVTINGERMGWHYHWVSNKHTCDAYHCVILYLFEMVSPPLRKLRCIGKFTSPSFQVYCRRRQRGGDKKLQEKKIEMARAAQKAQQLARPRVPKSTLDFLCSRAEQQSTEGMAIDPRNLLDVLKGQTSSLEAKLLDGTAWRHVPVRIVNGLLLVYKLCMAGDPLPKVLMGTLTYQTPDRSKLIPEQDGFVMPIIGKLAAATLCGILTGVDMTTLFVCEGRNVGSKFLEYFLNSETEFLQNFLVVNLVESDPSLLYEHFVQHMAMVLPNFLESTASKLDEFLHELNMESRHLAVVSAQMLLSVYGGDPPDNNGFQHALIHQLYTDPIISSAQSTGTLMQDPSAKWSGNWILVPNSTSKTSTDASGDAAKYLTEESGSRFFLRIFDKGLSVQQATGFIPKNDSVLLRDEKDHPYDDAEQGWTSSNTSRKLTYNACIDESNNAIIVSQYDNQLELGDRQEMVYRRVYTFLPGTQSTVSAETILLVNKAIKVRPIDDEVSIIGEISQRFVQVMDERLLASLLWFFKLHDPPTVTVPTEEPVSSSQ